MTSGWHIKPGDKVFRPRRIRRYHLRRVLGVAAVFSAGYGNVGSSIYYALGIVSLAAMGATPLALGIAGILFVFTALTYAEGTAMFPEAGGSASFARHGFNDFVSFLAGWALMLSYVVTISISAFTIPPYLGYFWAPLKESPIVGTSAAIVIILFLMTMNIIGIRETSVINIVAALMDIATQVSLVIIGFILLFNPSVLFQHIIGYWPTAGNLVMGIALASIAYTGIETTSQMAEETRKPEKNVPRALGLMIVAVLTIFAGISIVSLLAVSPEQLASEWARDPVAGIAANIPVAIIASIFKPLIGILAGTILLIATNAGLIGISRLAFSLGQYNLMPSVLSRVHPKFKTPYFSIIIFTVIAIVILIPGFFASNVFGGIGALYAFGSLLAFMFSHAAIISLRVRKPELPRPFKLGGNIRIKGRELPITALLGLLSTFIVWIIISIMQPFSSWVGFIWVAAGLVIYCLYRQKRRMPLLSVSKSVAK